MAETLTLTLTLTRRAVAERCKTRARSHASSPCRRHCGARGSRHPPGRGSWASWLAPLTPSSTFPLPRPWPHPHPPQPSPHSHPTLTRWTPRWPTSSTAASPGARLTYCCRATWHRAPLCSLRYSPSSRASIPSYSAPKARRCALAPRCPPPLPPSPSPLPPMHTPF